VNIALRTKNAKVADVRFDIPESFIRRLALEDGGRRAVLGIDSILNSFSPK